MERGEPAPNTCTTPNFSNGKGFQGRHSEKNGRALRQVWARLGAEGEGHTRAVTGAPPRGPPTHPAARCGDSMDEFAEAKHHVPASTNTDQQVLKQTNKLLIDFVLQQAQPDHFSLVRELHAPFPDTVGLSH